MSGEPISKICQSRRIKKGVITVTYRGRLEKGFMLVGKYMDGYDIYCAHCSHEDDCKKKGVYEKAISSEVDGVVEATFDCYKEMP